MEDKIKNTVIFFIAAMIFIVASASFLGLKDEKKKTSDVKTETPKQETPTPTTAGTTDANATNPSTPNTSTNTTDDSISQIDSITTSNYANLNLEYFYYIPQSVIQNKQQRHPYLIMVPGLNSRGQDFVTQPFKDFAKREGFVIIAPSFMEDVKNWASKTSYQYPAAWSGKALNDILNSFDSKQGMMPSRIYMLGFSAGAQFVSRYALLYPDYVTACAFNAAGGTDDPLKYQATKFYIAVGTQDGGDRKQIAQNFYNLAKQQGIDVTYKQYENVGHELSDQEINDELTFFSTINSMTKNK